MTPEVIVPLGICLYTAGGFATYGWLSCRKVFSKYIDAEEDVVASFLWPFAWCYIFGRYIATGGKL